MNPSQNDRLTESVTEQEDASEWISEVYEAFNNEKNARNTPICHLEAEALEEASYPRSIDRGHPVLFWRS